MLISHEVPLKLLEKSRNFNDYDYALVHLYDELKEYKQFFIDSVEKYDRKVILDNSIFELETMFDSDKFAKAIVETKPTEYIIPDSLENLNDTISSCDSWLDIYKDLSGVKIGVVQGKTIQEVIECYKYMSDKVDKIAISFDYSLYEDPSFNNRLGSKYYKWMTGRIDLLDLLESKNIINRNKPHHLLGCSLPQEFKKHSKRSYIESIDTSNPVVHAILNIKYDDNGLNDKQSIKLVELMQETKFNEDLVTYNVNMFREFCNGL